MGNRIKNLINNNNKNKNPFITTTGVYDTRKITNPTVKKNVPAPKKNTPAPKKSVKNKIKKESSVLSGVVNLGKDIIQAEVISKVLNKGDQIIGKAVNKGKSIPLLDTGYDAYNTISSLNKGDMTGVASNFVGALLPGVSGKTVEAVADNYIPKESQEGQDANAFITKYGTGSLGKELLDTYGQGYKSSKAFKKDLADGKLKDEESIKSHIRNYKKPNTKNIPINQFAMGGNLRPGSRQRHIAPAVGAALIGGGVQMLGSLFGLGAAAKAQKQQKKDLLAQEQTGLKNQFLEQSRQDVAALNNIDQYGEDDVQYYAGGGNINNRPDKMSQGLTPQQQEILVRSMTQSKGVDPNQPVSNGGYQTTGGQLVPIGQGMEEVKGNRHNETTIDGVSGVQLHKDGQVEAEVEDKEVIADGQYVYSDRLKYDGKSTYADKVKKLVKERNKLEKEQEEAKNKRKANTLERKLAGLNMAETALYQHQEMNKYKEGIEVANKFAMGGNLKPLPVRAKYSWETEEEYQDAIGNSNQTTTAPITAPASSVPTVPTTPIPEIRNPAEAYDQAITAKSSLGLQALGTGTGTEAAKGTDWKAIGNKALGVATTLTPMLIDNIGNAILTKNTPKIPTPLLNRAETLETRTNVNPQLAEIRRGGKSMRDNIAFNTSSSNNAKTNMVAADLATARESNNILGAKENQELALRNANVQNKQNVNMQNTATLNQNSMNEYQRANDMRTQRSANLANLQGDIKTTMSMKAAEKNFKGYTMANLADDDNGSKLMTYMHSPDFLQDPNMKAYALSKVEEKDAEGNYRFPGLRIKAQELGLIAK